MAIQGLRHTSNFAEGERPKNWREGILKNWPNGQMLLTGLTSQMKSSSVDDPEFYWWQKRMPAQRFPLDGSLSGTAEKGDEVTISLKGGGKQLIKSHVVRVEETGEILLVTETPSGDTSAKVQRGFAGSDVAALDPSESGKNPNLLVVGTVNEEGSHAPPGVNYDPEKVYNYTQIFRNTLEMTRTGSRTRLRTGDQIAEARRECLELHGNEMERAFWFGKPSEDHVDGKPRRTTGGVFHFIEEFDKQNGYVWDPMAGRVRTVTDKMVTLAWLEDILRDAFLWGSDEKMGVCGNQALQTIQRLVRYSSDYQISQGEKEYGMKITRLHSPFGTLALKTHPLWNYAPGGTNNGEEYFGLNSWLSILDMEHIRYRPFTGADTKYQKDLQENDLDGMKSGYLTEAGIEVNHPENHMLVKGLAHAAKEKPPEVDMEENPDGLASLT